MSSTQYNKNGINYTLVDNDNLFEISGNKSVFISNNLKVQKDCTILNKLDVSAVDISQVLIIPRRYNSSGDDKYTKGGTGSGTSGEIYYDTSENKFFGNYGNDEGFKEFGGGEGGGETMSESRNISILSLDNPYHNQDSNINGIYFFIGTQEDNRINNISSAVMKLEKDSTNNITLNVQGDVSCNYISCNIIKCTGDITAFASSDKRLKTNLVPIENPLDKLSKINGYNFEWIENKEVHSNKGKDVGVIAQEINEILPEITRTRDNGYMAVRYEKLTAFLISCVKEQQKIIGEQKRELEEQKEKLNYQESEINTLKFSIALIMEKVKL